MVNADRGAHVTVALEVAAERLPDPFEAWRHITVNRHHRNSISSNAVSLFVLNVELPRRKARHRASRPSASS
jgi:hypothetical protein